VADELTITRRELLTALGAGLLVAVTPEAADAQAGQPLATRFHIGEDGVITVLTGKVELGQGARTEITLAVAEELRLAPSKVRVLMADTALVPDDGTTAGSATTPRTVPAIRRAAAALREAGLRPDALSRPIPAEIELTPAEKWKVLGTPLRPVRGPEIVTGSHRFSRDLKQGEGIDRKSVMHGKIVRPPAYHATLVSFDASAASKMPGVKVVREGNLLGVVAPDPRTAEAAAEAIKAEWKTEPLPDEAELTTLFKANARQAQGGRGPGGTQRGDLALGLAAAARRHEASYSLPYIAHTPMEPRAALAAWNGDKLTVYTGTSGPFGVRRQLAQAFGVPEGNVRVVVPDTGNSFGGKHSAECPLEAARLAREAGQPVRLAWTRQEEFTWAYARPAGLIEVRSGTSSDGKIVAWDFHNYNSGGASIHPPYEIPNLVCAFHASETPLKQGSYRSLAAVANAFARETHIEELAALHHIDPLEFRLRNITNPRLREVLQRAAGKFGWGRGKSGSGAGCGMACNIEKDSLVALCAEVETGGKEPHVRRMTVAFDCGAVLNPDNLRNQITGALIMGMGGALFERLRFDRQKIVNARLSRYRVPRFSDAPAIGAALFAATGERRRRLPLLG